MPTLIGAGGHARDIYDDIQRWCQGFSKGGYQQVPHHTDWDRVGLYILGINDLHTRHEIATEFGTPDLSWVHSNAHVGPDCSWGDGTHINYGVTMTRTTIGEHCTIAPGVTICGDVTIGDRVFIGAGAVIVNLTTVPDDTFIKAGSVWTGR